HRKTNTKSFPAITRDKAVFVSHTGSQNFAEQFEAIITFQVAVGIVEQLEIIDIQHEQGDGSVQPSCALPLAFQPGVKTAPVGQAGKTVDRGQFGQLVVGRAQLALAACQSAGHVIKSRCQRHELGCPIFRPGADVEVTASDARGGAGERANRLDNQLFAADPSRKQGEEAKQDQFDIGNSKLSVDAAEDLAFLEPD